MKRMVTWILAVVLVFTLAACGESGKAVDLAALKEKIITELNIADPLDLPADRLADLYGIPEEDIKTSACFITLGTAFPDEIVLMEAVDASAADRAVEKLEARLAEVTNQARSYDGQSYALFQKCKVERVGNYVTLFISPKAEEMQKLFREAAK